MGPVRVRRVTLAGDQRCPLCRAPLGDAPAEALAVCAGCDVVHHLACADELGAGACATCGRSLDEAVVPDGPAPDARAGERALLVAAARGLGELLALVGLALLCLLLVVGAVAAVLHLRWPPWTLAAAFTAPLGAHGVLAWLRPARPRRRRSATAATQAKSVKGSAAEGGERREDP